MEPILTFDVTNQHIRRTDSFRVVAKSKNYLHAQFASDRGMERKRKQVWQLSVILNGDARLVPWVLKDRAFSVPYLQVTSSAADKVSACI